MDYTVYSITDNKGELYLITKDKQKAKRVLYQLAMIDLSEYTNVCVEDNEQFLTVVDCNGEMFSEYYLHETQVEELTA